MNEMSVARMPVLRFAPGLLLSAGLAAAAMALGAVPMFADHGFSALVLAIVLGIVLGNLLPGRAHVPIAAGIGFSKHWLLRAGIVLYGLRLTLQDIGSVGVSGVVLDGLMVVSTFALACALGVYWLKLDRDTAMLIGAGSAICGAAAVMAAGPVLRARPEQVSVAIATVVVFGTLAMFVYPLLYPLNQSWGWIPGGEHGFGMYVGASVHEVAQVLAIGRQISEPAADTALISKMVRVMLLAPFLLVLAAWCARRKVERGLPRLHGTAGQAPLYTGNAGQGKFPLRTFTIPWFAFGFIGVVVVNSWLHLPAGMAAAMHTLDTVMLAMAMAALGVSTRAGALAQAGIKPLLLALVLFAWLMLGGAGLYMLVG